MFKRIPRIERFRRDLIKAGIPPQDANGCKALLHSLRNSDRRLTDKIYTAENLLGTWSAFDSLPNYSERASQIASQVLCAAGHNVSSAVTMGGGVKADKTVATIGESPVLTLPVTSSQNVVNGGSGGARTRNLCRDRAAL